MYKPMVKILGLPENIFFPFKLLMVSHKTIHKAFRIHKIQDIEKTH